MATMSFDQFLKNNGVDSKNPSQLSAVKTLGVNHPAPSLPAAIAKKPGSSIVDAFKSGIDKTKTGYTQAQNAHNPLELIEGGLKQGAGVVEAATAPLAPVFKPLGDAINYVGDKIGDIPAVQRFANSKAGETTSRIAEDVADATTIAGAVAGVKGGAKVVSGASDIAGDLSRKIDNAGGAIKGKVASLTPDSATIMNKVARLKPTDATKFEKLSGGKTHGEYLAETGNFGAPDKIITNEATKFTQSLADKKAALAELPGVFKDGAISDALEMLVEKAKSESSPNIKSPYLNQVLELQRKHNQEGLSMIEAENVKSLLEGKVKLGYNKMMNPEKVNQATNIDDSLRKWQDTQAKELGLENISELNKQTQLSRFIVDKLGDQIVGKNGLNGINLTDWIVLSGGDPTSVAGFLTKKFFSSKNIQAKIAEMLNKGEIKGPVKAKVGLSKVKQLPAPKEGAKQSENYTAPKLPTRKLPDEKGVIRAKKK